VLEDESVLAFFSAAFLWCFFLGVVDFDVSDVDDEEAAGVAAGAGVDWAKAGPAIRARAMTGMSFLNIDVVSRREVVCAQGAREAGVLSLNSPRTSAI
jgi:uncharacterized protein (UPF0264 family)